MGFSKMLELLQEKNKGYIILANAGAFYLAKGKNKNTETNKKKNTKNIKIMLEKSKDLSYNIKN